MWFRSDRRQPDVERRQALLPEVWVEYRSRWCISAKKSQNRQDDACRSRARLRPHSSFCEESRRSFRLRRRRICIISAGGGCTGGETAEAGASGESTHGKRGSRDDATFRYTEIYRSILRSPAGISTSAPTQAEGRCLCLFSGAHSR